MGSIHQPDVLSDIAIEDESGEQVDKRPNRDPVVSVPVTETVTGQPVVASSSDGDPSNNVPVRNNYRIRRDDPTSCNDCCAADWCAGCHPSCAQWRWVGHTLVTAAVLQMFWIIFQIIFLTQVEQEDMADWFEIFVGSLLLQGIIFLTCVLYAPHLYKIIQSSDDKIPILPQVAVGLSAALKLSFLAAAAAGAFGTVSSHMILPTCILWNLACDVPCLIGVIRFNCARRTGTSETSGDRPDQSIMEIRGVPLQHHSPKDWNWVRYMLMVYSIENIPWVILFAVFMSNANDSLFFPFIGGLILFQFCMWPPLIYAFPSLSFIFCSIFPRDWYRAIRFGIHKDVQNGSILDGTVQTCVGIIATLLSILVLYGITILVSQDIPPEYWVLWVVSTLHFLVACVTIWGMKKYNKHTRMQLMAVASAQGQIIGNPANRPSNFSANIPPDATIVQMGVVQGHAPVFNHVPAQNRN